MSSASTEAGRSRPWLARHRRYSIRTNLIVLVGACMLPSFGALAVFVYEDHLQREDAVRRETLLSARSVMAAIDRDLAKVESSLTILATSTRLAAGDIPAFAERLRTTPRSLIVLNYVLSDRDGREFINTVAPGALAPEPLAPTELSRVFETGQPAVSHLFDGPLHHQPVITVSVPVRRDGDVVYALTAEISPAQLGGILVKDPLPPHWVAALLDETGTIVARSRSSWRFAGQKAGASLVMAIARYPEDALEAVDKDGDEVITAFTRSSMSGLRMIINAPRAALTTQLSSSLATLIGAGAAALALALWFAMRLAGRIGRSVEGLIAPALALGNGKPVELPESTLKEAEALGRALQQGSRMLAEANHQAHHDALTGLCNRTLFDELVAHQLAFAQRSGSRLAILAIDLDGFKEVNDRHGHGVGDAVLKIAAERIRHGIRGADVVSRRGGDEFTVLLNNVDQALTQRIGDKLVAALAEPYPGVGPLVSASIGVALYPDSGTTVAALLERADRALYEAKHGGKRCLAGDVVAGRPEIARIQAFAQPG
jgi:diguanylate cyclase (GGDEF)-like protein